MADNIVVWADIPVLDLQRANTFYAHVTGKPVNLMPGADDVSVIGGPSADPHAAPPADAGMAVSADLYTGADAKPSTQGATVYFSSGGDIDGMLVRVREAGGTVLQEKQFMGEMIGWIAFVMDTEGNRIGIQQPGKAS